MTDYLPGSIKHLNTLLGEQLTDGEGGGGGSSDFSTATVTIIGASGSDLFYVPYETTLMGLDTSHSKKAGEGEITAILYKGNAVLTCISSLYDTATVTGNAQKVTTQSGFGYIKISGDCSISFGK